MKEDSSHQNCHSKPPILRGRIPAPPHAPEAPVHLLHWDGGPAERQQMLAAQAKRAPHLNRHACSARRRRTSGSLRALASANSRTNVFVSSDHRPPISPRQNDQPCPVTATNQLWVGPFLPPTCDCQCCLRPCVHSQGAIRHSAEETRKLHRWQAAPPTRGRPSTRISNLRPSRATGTGRSKSRNMTFVATLPPASRHTRVAALSTANPRLPNTPALAHGEGETEQVRIDPSPRIRWTERERRQPGHGSALGTQ